ncbi:type II TA system antitoxin MqsA family protein [Paraburkholderia sp.]|uniref:type II TA system antitoxin MqsA family protein n=1 Tax=Paraburkholderia sp. TaxID=1926495 RepID=UPI00286F1E32|nr:type II TA system antitoxin MqsA family protein [Paraburkholderia sp.]
MKTCDCAVCGEHAAVERLRAMTFAHEGKILSYEERAWVCGSCESEFVDAEQSKHNKRAAIAARNAHDGAPSCIAIRNWRKKWGLTQQEAGRLLGVGPVAFSKYENDDLVPSAPTLRLLFLVIKSDEAVRALAARVGVELGGVANQSDVTLIASETVIQSSSERIETKHSALDEFHTRKSVTRWFSEEKRIRRSNETSLEAISL